MQRSYLDYAMSVIVSRALPDCRDGMKPVHRRILYAMHEKNLSHDKPYRKSATVVGEVLGKYHPHGDSAVYSAMVRMAQDFSLRDMLVDGQGNFGSVDGDPAAQMRYTEVRLAKISQNLLIDIEHDTVDFQDNYDGSEQEPKVLPARFPNLLVNGANGIAVGMATSIPPHNLGEILDACIAYIQDRDVAAEELLNYVKGPDFPTGGEIIGEARVRQGLLTGRSAVTVRGKVCFEDVSGGRSAIIITEIPYQVNKSELIKSIEHLYKEKSIEGISEIRDETNRLGMRVVIELKKDAMPEVIVNQLYRHTQLQTSFSVNMLALVKGAPTVMGLRDVIVAFIEFRQEVVTRRITFLLSKARGRAHILLGLAIAVINIDEVITLIKGAADPIVAKAQLIQKMWKAGDIEPLLQLVDDFRNKVENGYCNLTEEQAKAILEMRLQRLTGLERNKIDNELEQLGQEITGYLDILNDKARVLNIVESELREIKEGFSTPRRTQIIASDVEIEDEDLIQCEDMVVTFTRSGYIKRVPLAAYRAQKRGGRGKSGVQMNDDDITQDVLITNTHTSLLFFTDMGRVYKIKVYKLPLGTPQTKGRALVNILQFATNTEKLTNIMPMPDDKESWKDAYIIFSTACGNIRRNALADFEHIQSNGKIAIRLEPEDKLVAVAVCDEEAHIMLSTLKGKAIRFPVKIARVFKSRTSDGIRGIKLAKSDTVISLSILKGIEIEQAKREEYLKIALEKRKEIATASQGMILDHIVKDLNLTLLTPDEALYYGQNEEFILVVTENGFGKRTSAYEYRVTNRGGSGIANLKISNKNGDVVSSFPVDDKADIMLMTDQGTIIRTQAKDIRVTGRDAIGVKIIALKDDGKVSAVSQIKEQLSDDEDIQEDPQLSL